MSLVTVAKDIFGKTKDNEEVERYTFQNQNRVTVEILTYGAIVKSIIVPDKNGTVADICLGFDDMEGYGVNSPYFGAVCGRVANRIAGGKFTLDGNDYSLPVNNGPNSLHGGIKGFDKAVWSATLEGSKLRLTYTSKDGEEGYPGDLTNAVTYELTNENELIIDYTSTTTIATPINLTNHAYFNLAGQGAADINDHVITLIADNYLLYNEDGVPTGEIASVEGKPVDLRTPVKMGERLENIPGGKGFDTSYCVGNAGERKPVARVTHPNGRSIDVWTTEPGLQLYTSYYLDNVSGKGGTIYGRYAAFCLETQHHPDSIHHDHFPNTILRPGETYRHTSGYKFGING